MTYNWGDTHVIRGTYVNKTGTLAVTENYKNPVGSVDIQKRITGFMDGFPYALNYQGSD